MLPTFGSSKDQTKRASQSSSFVSEYSIASALSSIESQSHPFAVSAPPLPVEKHSDHVTSIDSLRRASVSSSSVSSASILTKSSDKRRRRSYHDIHQPSLVAMNLNNNPPTANVRAEAILSGAPSESTTATKTIRTLSVRDESNPSIQRQESASSQGKMKREPSPSKKKQLSSHMAIGRSILSIVDAARDRQWREHILQTYASLKIGITYVLTGNRKDKRSFSIGLLTVFLVVSFLSLIQNALSNSPMVFVKIAENSIGQFDMVMSPLLSDSSRLFINYTQVNSSLTGSDVVLGAAPRWLGPAILSRPPTAPNDTTTGSIVEITDVSVILIVLDSALETSIDLARAWPYRALGDTEILVTASVLRALRLRPNSGDKVRLTLDLAAFFTGKSTASVANSTATSNNVTVPLSTVADNVSNLPNGDLIAAAILGNNNQTNATVTVPANVANQAAQQQIQNLLTFVGDLTVVDAIVDPYTKYPQALGNVAIIERKYFEQILLNVINQASQVPPVASELPFNATTFKLNEYAMTVLLLFKNRMYGYSLDQISRKNTFIQWSNSIVRSLGRNFPATYTLPLCDALDDSNFISILLTEIFFAIMVVLIVLAVLLIYSLLLADIEDKTFEYGMLRTLGMNQTSLLQLLTFQSFYFSLPGITFGLLVCYLIYVPTSFVLAQLTTTLINASLQTAAILLGILLGLFLPLLGMLLPIRRALTKTLRDALDVYHNVVFDTNVQIQKLEDIGMSPFLTIVSILMVGIGIMVYYLVPLSFLFNELGLFFRVLNIIFLGLVAGLIFMGTTVQSPIQYFLLKCIMWGSDRKLMSVVEKNLESHSNRNRKTSIMFNLCLAYVIFAATMFALQINTLNETSTWLTGSDIEVDGGSFTSPLPESELRNYFAKVIANNDATGRNIVIDFSFITLPLTSFPWVQSTFTATFANMEWVSVRIMAVNPNYLQITAEKFLLITETKSSINNWPNTPLGNKDPIGALPIIQVAPIDKRPGFQLPQDGATSMKTGDPDGFLAPVNASVAYNSAIPLVISESLRDRMYVDTNTIEWIIIQSFDSSSNVLTRYLPAMPIAMIKKMPGFSDFSSFINWNSPAFIPEAMFVRLVNEIAQKANVNIQYNSIQDIPKQVLRVKVHPKASDLQVEALVNDLNSILSDSSKSVQNLRVELATTKSAGDILLMLFNVVAFVGLVFLFFALWLSFVANIRENAWEFGVLRAMGLSGFTVVRLYIYEALSLVLSCIFIGTSVGIATASTLTIQFNIFNEMPFNLQFAGSLFGAVVVCTIMVAILGSYIPANEFRFKQIASAIKGL